MGKFNSFCRRHLGEMVFAVWTAAMIAASWFWFGNSVIRGIIGFIGTVVVAWGLSFTIRTKAKRDMLMYDSFVSAILIAVAISVLAEKAGDGTFILCVLGALSCSILCSKIIEKCTATNLDMERLRNTDYNAFLHKMVDLGRFLEPEDELALMELSDAKQILETYICNYRLWRVNEGKFLNDQRFADLWGRYFKHYALFDKDELALFDRPDAKEIVDLYCRCTEMCERAELKLFSMPDPESWVRMYIGHGAFGSEKAELKLFEMPHAEELVKLYTKKYVLYNPAFRKAKELGWI